MIENQRFPISNDLIDTLIGGLADTRVLYAILKCNNHPTVSMRYSIILSLQISPNHLDGLLDGEFVGVEGEVGAYGRFVGGIESGESLEFAAFGFVVESLGIALLCGFGIAGNVDFDEFSCGEQLTHPIAVVSEGGYKGAENDVPVFEEEAANLSNAPDVFGTIAVGESKVAVQSVSNLFPIEQHRLLLVFPKGCFEGFGNGTFACAGDACKPKNDR